MIPGPGQAQVGGGREVQGGPWAWLPSCVLGCGRTRWALITWEVLNVWGGKEVRGRAELSLSLAILAETWCPWKVLGATDRIPNVTREEVPASGNVGLLVGTPWVLSARTD